MLVDFKIKLVEALLNTISYVIINLEVYHTIHPSSKRSDNFRCRRRIGSCTSISTIRMLNVSQNLRNPLFDPFPVKTLFDAKLFHKLFHKVTKKCSRKLFE